METDRQAPGEPESLTRRKGPRRQAVATVPSDLRLTERRKAPGWIALIRDIFRFGR
jgi:hypothetical protein